MEPDNYKSISVRAQVVVAAADADGDINDISFTAPTLRTHDNEWLKQSR